MGDMSDTKRSCIWMRWTARILALAWAGFWIWFGLASGVAESAGIIGTIIHTAMPGLILLASALFAWKYEKIGGRLLIVEGIIIAVFYPLIYGVRFPLSTVIYVLLTMAAPPLLAGALFALHYRRAATVSKPQRF